MNKKRVISIAAVLVLIVLSVLAIRFDSRPVYLGLVFAYIGIALIGLFSNRLVSAISSIAIICLGYSARVYAPVGSTLKGDKLEAFIRNQNNHTEFIGSNLIFFVGLGILVALLFSYLGMKIEKRESKFSTNRITYLGIFVALSVMINTMRVGSVSFGGFPIIFSGYLLGPVNGFIVGGVADVVGFIVRPSSFAFNPLFTLTSALTGAIPVIVTWLLGDKYPKYNLIKVLAGIFVGQILTSVILVPLFSSILYELKDTFYILVGKAFIKQIVSIPIYAFLITTISDRLTKVIDFNRELNK